MLGRRARGPVVGVLGCMAERLKDRLLERQKLVDVVAGPDAYRDLPRLLAIVQVWNGEQGLASPGPQAWPRALPCHCRIPRCSLEGRCQACAHVTHPCLCW